MDLKSAMPLYYISMSSVLTVFMQLHKVFTDNNAFDIVIMKFFLILYFK